MKCTAPQRYRFYVGIDTGVHTAICFYSAADKKIETLQTMRIDEALFKIRELGSRGDVLVRFEDARKRKWFGNSGSEMWQGAGSVKRDGKIWDDFLSAEKIPYEAVAPARNTTKLTAQEFSKITGYEGRTNEHERDAAMLVYGL